jgi:hypothetical protein
VRNISLAENAVDHVHARRLQRGPVFRIGILDRLLRLRIDGLLVAENHVAAFRIRLQTLFKPVGVVELIERAMNGAAVLVGTVEQRGHAFR